MTRSPARVAPRLLTKAEAAEQSSRPRRGVKFKIVSLGRIGVDLDQKGRAGTAIGPDDAVIYVVGFADYVKIGFTNSLEARLRMLQSHAPEVLKVYAYFHGTKADERRFHAEFADQRLQGEWFRRAGRLRVWINEMSAQARRKAAA